VGREIDPDEPSDEEDEQPGASEEDADEADDRASDPSPSRRARWEVSPRRLRIFELVLVLLVSFGSSLLGALWHWWTGDLGGAAASVGGLVNAIQRQVVELALLAYVLFRRGQTFRDLGLTLRWIDLPAGGLLYVAMALADSFAHDSINWLTLAATDHPASFAPSHAHYAGVAAITLTLIYAVIDPVNEELIVRAFTMTEIAALTGSTALAIAASVGLQTAYHLYQGLPNALTRGAAFLVAACFYARFRRILPVILAHVLWDLFVVLRHI
jgi:membrane protease YdiL (CAAX protease family)